MAGVPEFLPGEDSPRDKIGARALPLITDSSSAEGSRESGITALKGLPELRHESQATGRQPLETFLNADRVAPRFCLFQGFVGHHSTRFANHRIVDESDQLVFSQPVDHHGRSRPGPLRLQALSVPESLPNSGAPDP